MLDILGILQKHPQCQKIGGSHLAEDSQIELFFVDQGKVPANTPPSHILTSLRVLPSRRQA
jgi:hypothetical protein